MLEVHQGDCLTILRTLASESIHTCVTSPPYWGLRDYGVDGQLGLEKTPEEYVARLVEIFREVKRVLRNDATAWIILGDSYAGGNGRWGGDNRLSVKQSTNKGCINQQAFPVPPSCKPKDLVGIPWMVAFALRSDGWYLRSDIIWNKLNPMPESVEDRPTKSHEYIFLLSKSQSYYYDAEAIKEQSLGEPRQRMRPNGKPTYANFGFDNTCGVDPSGRNKRSVWTIASQPYNGAHFATFPEDLIKPCILAGTSAKGCCAACGAPWERILEKGELSARTENDGNGYHLPKAISVRDDAKIKGRSEGWQPNHKFDYKTVGWQQTCKCSEAEIIPCTVLDHFAGSGTTGKVAIELGRKAVLAELNPEYIKLINKRCETTPALLGMC